MKINLLAATALALATSSPAYAILNVPVPTNAFISFGGLDWAWAAPCAPSAPTCGEVDFTYQGTQGWRLPTLAEFSTGPAPSDFIFAGANVPVGGASANGTIFPNAPGDGACAAAYFTVANRNNCDYNDAVQGAIFGNGGPFTGNPNVETWVVRGRVAGAVPESSTWMMMLAGFGLAGGAMRYRRRTLRVSFGA